MRHDKLFSIHVFTLPSVEQDDYKQYILFGSLNVDEYLLEVACPLLLVIVYAPFMLMPINLCNGSITIAIWYITFVY